MIRVVHVMDGLGWAGMEQMVKSLVCHIDKSKFNVILLSEIPMKESVRGQVAELNQKGVEVLFLQDKGTKKFVAMDYYRLFRRIHPYVVHSHSGVWRDSCIGAMLARVPHIFHTEHGRVILDQNTRSKLTHRYLSFFRDKIIPVSEELRQFLSKEVGIPERKLMTIHNGIDPGKYMPLKRNPEMRRRLGLEEDQLLIMAVGRINPVKDYPTLIRATYETKKALGDKRGFKLAIVGPETQDHLSGGGVMDDLHTLCNELGVSNEINFLGKRDDIPELLAQADIFIQTSLTEGLSMSIMEAMSCELPLVATNVGGNRELILDGETGLLVKSRDPRSVSGGLEKLILDENLRRKMGLNGRKRIIEEFSLDVMTHKYESLYLSAAAGREA